MAKNIQDFLYGDKGRSLVYQGKITELPANPREGGVYLVSEAFDLASNRLSVGTFITFVNGSWEEWGGSSSGGMEWKYVNSNTTVEDGFVYIVDTSNQEVVLNALPTLHNSARFAVVGFGSTFSQNRLRVNMNNQRVNGTNHTYIDFENSGESALFYKIGGNAGWAAIEYGDNLIVQQYDESTVASIIILQDNGSGETHRGILTYADLIDLISGAKESVTITTTEDNGHTHTLVVRFIDGELDVTIVNNHPAPYAHTIEILGFGSGSGDMARVLQEAKDYTDQEILELELGTASKKNVEDFASAAQGSKADSAIQEGDNVSRLINDAGFITTQELPEHAVTSVAGKTGAVTLEVADITDLDITKFATSEQGAKADTALQEGDNVSKLANDAGYLTDADLSQFVTETELESKGYLTESDLTDYVTEEDLADYVTEEDLADYVTEEDLTGYAKTEDLEAYVSKEELTPAVTDIIDEAGYLTEDTASDLFPLLGDDRKVSENELPDYTYYRGEWDAERNIPQLIDNMQDVGHFYRVSVAGQNPQTNNRDWQVGDWAVCTVINEAGDTEWSRWEFSRIFSALGMGDPISLLENDSGYITEAALGAINARLDSLPSTFVESIGGLSGAVELVSSMITDLSENAINPSEKGTPDGVATLDSNGKVQVSQLPDDLFKGLTFRGGWNAETNEPELVSGVGEDGSYYIVDVAGDTNLDGNDIWRERDWVVFAGNKWVRVKNTISPDVVMEGNNISRLVNDVGYITIDDVPTPTIPVTSVAGKTGAVTLEVADITDLDVTKFATSEQGAKADSALQEGDDITKLANNAGYITIDDIPAQVSPVTSVAGKTGDVTLEVADITDLDVAKFATSEQGAKADTALQEGDKVSKLDNDAGYITIDDIPAQVSPVTSVAGKTGDVTLEVADITDLDTTKFATSEQGVKADTALQEGDNVSKLANDAGYLTNADIPTIPVTSVAGKTGAVTLEVADITDLDVTKFATSEQGVKADTALQEGDDITKLVNNAGYITIDDVPTPTIPVTSVAGKTGAVTLEVADITDLDTTKFATSEQGAKADSALQEGDSVSKLDNDAGYITIDDVPTPTIPVTSVAGKTGAVTLEVADITDLDITKFATAEQGAKADTALQEGDDITELANNAGYITIDDIPAAPVTSVAGKTGAVTLEVADITDLDTSKFATSEQGAKADTALQEGDNVSKLNNDAGYITIDDVPTPTIPVTSVAGKTGAVTLEVADITDLDVTKFATSEQGAKADTALQEGDPISKLDNDAGYVTEAPEPLKTISGTVNAGDIVHRGVYKNSGTATFEFVDMAEGTTLYVVNTDGEDINFTYPTGEILTPAGTTLSTRGAWVSVMYIGQGLISIVGDL